MNFLYFVLLLFHKMYSLHDIFWKDVNIKLSTWFMVQKQTHLKHSLRGATGGISVILIKNQFFILLNKFNLHTIIYILWSFRPLSLFCSHLSGHMLISVPFTFIIRGVFHSIFLYFHFLKSLTNSKCKGFYNFQATKLNFFSVCFTRYGEQN